MSKHGLWLGIMNPVIEPEFRLALRRANRPTRKASRHFDHVLLGVSAVHAERVQFHQLAAVIFVESPVLDRRLRLPWRLTRYLASRRAPWHARRSAKSPPSETSAVHSASRLL